MFGTPMKKYHWIFSAVLKKWLPQLYAVFLLHIWKKNVYHCLLSCEYIFLLLIPKLTFACQRKQTYINILLCMHISLQNQNSLKKQTVCLQKEIGKENIRSRKTFLLRQFKIPLKPGRVNSQQDTYIIMSSFGLDAFMNVCTGVYCK